MPNLRSTPWYLFMTLPVLETQHLKENTVLATWPCASNEYSLPNSISTSLHFSPSHPPRIHALNATCRMFYPPYWTFVIFTPTPKLMQWKSLNAPTQTTTKTLCHNGVLPTTLDFLVPQAILMTLGLLVITTIPFFFFLNRVFLCQYKSITLPNSKVPFHITLRLTLGSPCYCSLHDPFYCQQLPLHFF